MDETPDVLESSIKKTGMILRKSNVGSQKVAAETTKKPAEETKLVESPVEKTASAETLTVEEPPKTVVSTSMEIDDALVDFFSSGVVPVTSSIETKESQRDPNKPNLYPEQRKKQKPQDHGPLKTTETKRLKMDLVDSQISQYREAAKAKYAQKRAEKKAIEIEEQREKQIEDYRLQQYTSLVKNFDPVKDADVLEQLLWSPEEIEAYMIIPSANKTPEEEANIGALYLMKVLSSRNSVLAFDIRQLVHAAQVGNREPPEIPEPSLAKPVPLNLDDWQRVVKRWSLVGSHKSGMTAFCKFLRQQARPLRVPDDSADPFTQMRLAAGQTDTLDISASYGSFFAYIGEDQFNWFLDFTEGNTNMILEMRSMHPERFRTLYIPVGNGKRYAKVPGTIELHPIMMEKYGFTDGEPVQIRLVIPPPPRANPRVSISLMPLGNDTVEISADNLKHALEQHRIIQPGQVIMVLSDALQPFDDAKPYAVLRTWSEKFLSPVIDVYQKDVSIDIEECRPEFAEISGFDAVNKWFWEFKNMTF